MKVKLRSDSVEIEGYVNAVGRNSRLITDDEAYFLVSNGIQEIRENGFGRENIPAMMAAVVVISVPLIVLFLIFRKKVMAGVSRGGTKG